jgi:hypothetical protein
MCCFEDEVACFPLMYIELFAVDSLLYIVLLWCVAVVGYLDFGLVFCVL